MRRRRPPGLTLGTFGPWWWPRTLKLTQGDISNHRHIIGTTGVGKSKLLASLFTQLVTQGTAASLVDPHSDLAEEALALLLDAGYPRDKLLFVDFSRRDRYLPFNVLNQPYDDHSVARNIVETVKRVWPALAEGAAPAFENILLHGSFALIQNQRPLTDLPLFIERRDFRDMLLEGVTDPRVQSYWRDYFDRLPERDRYEEVQSTIRRVSLLTFNPALRYTLGQAENVLDFRRIMDDGVSVIYDLGGLDEEVQKFLGALLTVGYEVASLSRADTPTWERREHHLFLDEFSMFSAQSAEALSRILSLARKYGLFLVMAHQTWSQVSSRLQGALSNTQTVSFRLGRSDAVWMAPGLVKFNPLEVKHEVEQGQERSHPLFYSLPETFEQMATEIENLPRQFAFVKLGGHVERVRTPHVGVPRVTRDVLARVKEEYAEQLMVPAEDVIGRVDDLSYAAVEPPARGG